MRLDRSPARTCSCRIGCSTRRRACRCVRLPTAADAARRDPATPWRDVRPDRRALQPRAVQHADRPVPGNRDLDRWNGYSASTRPCARRAGRIERDFVRSDELPSRDFGRATASSSRAACSPPGAPTSTSITTATGSPPRSRHPDRAAPLLEQASPKRRRNRWHRRSRTTSSSLACAGRSPPSTASSRPTTPPTRTPYGHPPQRSRSAP